MTHPLVSRLTDELGYPALATMADVTAFSAAPGDHAIFVPGDARRNLETPDVAIILPELRRAFGNRFDCAVATDAVEAALRDATGIHKTPSLIFFRDGARLGGIPRVRDWSDYVARITQLLGLVPATQDGDTP